MKTLFIWAVAAAVIVASYLVWAGAAIFLAGLVICFVPLLIVGLILEAFGEVFGCLKELGHWLVFGNNNPWLRQG